ncbi:hypothetical protein [Streptomyces sp. NPDC008150]|uniref:hypothetical protein n=1 Tax=Streptomyces sp. NPDC008150 TaxID=3364816 RepID=UPI0036E70337
MGFTDFPDDLVRIQHAWNTTYRALAAHRPQEAATLRRRLLRLSVRLWWHPFWNGTTQASELRGELRRAVRARESTVA